MQNLTRKIFGLNDMKYGWSLLVSILVCGITFYIDRNPNPDDLFLLSAGYGMSFVIAIVWGAAKEAISQFKVKEFLSLSKHTTIFELHAHYYLIGWTIVAIAVLIALGLAGNAAPPFSLPMLLVESVLVAYGAGFIALFFVYKLLDALIYKKLRE
ncbi:MULTISPECIES: hypothetical protein [unclassified Paenibacillus]|uniref:hypothetical protein n=1 Tax=unclassified Paenibacillus TaxID=185978 RepID=UPI001C11C1D2|nr:MULTISPECIES: hypothetical protein [unclassified Paenibacillus]MBU5441113.1 hypothetical protein [Paenibacillus sp. MSJ-34]CAH0119764.1 hypothetical protein PAE9249_02272 [Paenibacillus sp. CECT 9249]